MPRLCVNAPTLPYSDMRIPSLPPHVGWPLLVVGLLSISISASVYTLFAAQSDGGPEVVSDYYEKGVHWDERRAARQAGDALAVTVDVEPSTDPARHDTRLRPVVVTVRDSTGRPVDALRGSIRAFRPQIADPVATIPLSATETPGVYRQMVPVTASGLWDFELDVTRDGQALATTVRVEVAPTAASTNAP